MERPDGARLGAEEPDLEKKTARGQGEAAKIRVSVERYFAAFEADTLKPGLPNEKVQDPHKLAHEKSARSRPATAELPPFNVKDHEDRQVPIPKTTVTLLADLIMASASEDAFILLSPERNSTVIRKWREHRRLGKPWTNGCMTNNTLREFRRHANQASIAEPGKLTVHTLRKSCGVNWANHLPIHVAQAYMGHADITTTQQYYLSVGEEHAKHAAWVIEQVTMLDGDKNDARMTPGPQKDSIRRVG